LILVHELDLLKKYDKKSSDVKLALIQKEGETYAELFLDLLETTLSLKLKQQQTTTTNK